MQFCDDKHFDSNRIYSTNETEWAFNSTWIFILNLRWRKWFYVWFTWYSSLFLNKYQTARHFKRISGGKLRFNRTSFPHIEQKKRKKKIVSTYDVKHGISFCTLFTCVRFYRSLQNSTRCRAYNTKSIHTTSNFIHKNPLCSITIFPLKVFYEYIVCVIVSFTLIFTVHTQASAIKHQFRTTTTMN